MSCTQLLRDKMQGGQSLYHEQQGLQAVSVQQDGNGKAVCASQDMPCACR